MERPSKLVYLSSGMHRMVQTNFSDIIWEKRTWAGSTAYAESKLYDVLLAFAISRRWRDVFSNAWSQVGWPREWTVQVRPMILTKRTSRRRGWQPAMNQLRWLRASISTTRILASRTRRCTTPRCRTGWSMPASDSRVLDYRREGILVGALYQVCANTRNQFLKHIFSISGSP
jgi:hypothetical protein